MELELLQRQNSILKKQVEAANETVEYFRILLESEAKKNIELEERLKELDKETKEEE